ncbi:spore coat protein YlbD [Siminovitchia sp. 179-K 8D1 HS]|uniref:spore coat protein YlbD n=1 Tax=Siminovitchia sp. 179-K 8D1 HS TaxID=3142385 RepID=UPI0039A3D098
MTRKKLHPSVEQFKQFVREHPNLVKLVRAEENTWQELYEEWYLLGEDDPKWEKYKKGNTAETNENKDDVKKWVHQFSGLLKKMDVNQMQYHIDNLSQAIGAIQGLLSQFQGSSQQQSNPVQEAPRNPFAFRKD